MTPFADHRAAAMALLTSAPLKPREGQFCGQMAFDASPLSERQASWLRILLERHGLPPLTEGGEV